MSGIKWEIPGLDIAEKAIFDYDLESLERLLADKTPEFCGQALFIAVWKGVKDIARVNNGGNGKEEVITTLKDKNKELVKFFLDRGADIHATLRSLAISNLIEYACSQASLDIVKLMIDGDFSSNKLFYKHFNPIQHAFYGPSGRIDKMNLFLDQANAENVNEWHLLHLYVENAIPPQEDMLIKLLNLGADVNAIAFNDTVLNCACKGENLEAFKFLIKNGANVNGFNAIDESELTSAISYGQVEFVKILLEHGANPNLGEGILPIEEPIKNYPLHGAISLRYVLGSDKCREIMELLLKYGAEINGYEDYHSTPLQWAVMSGNAKALELLLDRGADINKEVNRITALGTSITYQELDLSKILVRRMILMMGQGFEISKANLNTVNTVESLNVFKDECIEEIRLLKDKTFEDSCLSYFAIYEIKEVCKLAGLASNESIVQVLKSNDFNDKFPIYGQMIVEHFHKGILRNKDFELVKRFINYLSTRDHDQLPKLTFVAISEIFTHLNAEDVAKLREL